MSTVLSCMLGTRNNPTKASPNEKPRRLRAGIWARTSMDPRRAPEASAMEAELQGVGGSRRSVGQHPEGAECTAGLEGGLRMTGERGRPAGLGTWWWRSVFRKSSRRQRGAQTQGMRLGETRWRLKPDLRQGTFVVWAKGSRFLGGGFSSKKLEDGDDRPGP